MRFRIPAVLVVIATAVGCLSKAEVDPNETTKTLVKNPEIQDYDPANSIIPFPNTLLIDPTTGRNDLPATCGETAGAAGLREGILNTLDGFGTWETVTYATFTSQVSLDSTNGRVFLMKVAADATTATAVPTVVSRFQAVRYSEALPECGDSSIVEGISIVPTVPLDDNAAYVIAITQGVTNTDGTEFQPSTSWFFSRQETCPVTLSDANGDGIIEANEVTANYTPLDVNDPRDLNGDGEPDVLAELAGIQQLCQINQTFLPFTELALATVTESTVTRDDILIAWEFKTQTVEVPLDPAVSKGPASHVKDQPLSFGFAPALASATGEGGAPTPTQFIEAQLGAGVCSELHCEAINEILAGQFEAFNYQVPGPNTGVLSGLVPGPWATPIDPPQATGPVALNILAVTPVTTMPTGGWPIVVFGHGLERSKGDLLAIASQLAGAGMASIAVDWPLHGDRAIQIYPSGSACQSAGDAGDADFLLSPECFQPILSTNLAATRDNVRQGVVDVLRMIQSMKTVCAVGGTVSPACSSFSINPGLIGYLGQSLGSIIGSMPVGTSPDIHAAVLNVPGVSWLTILENTDTNLIKCPLFDALINNGTLQGKLWQQPDGSFNTTDALCIQTDTTKPVAVVADAAYQAFASAARWILDPADGVNFEDRIGGKIKGSGMTLLIQEVTGDPVVPNEATAILAQLLGFAANGATAAAEPGISGTFTPTAGLNNPANVLTWLAYNPSATSEYGHGSLLVPNQPDPSTPPTIAAQLGTGQMQTDAITFLATHLHPAGATQTAK